MSLIQRIKCKLGYHHDKSYEYVRFDFKTGNLILRCINCKEPIIVKPAKKGTESGDDEKNERSRNR